MLKQFGDLKPEDFQQHPVWIGCHTVDYDEPWYDDTDEETFRPRTGAPPADPAEGILLVRATATLSDGTVLPAFITPDSGDGDVGTMQPYVFVGDSKVGFWRTPDGVQRDFYASLRKDSADVFPLRVAAESGVSNGHVATTISEWLPTKPLKRLRGLFRGGA